MLRRLRAAVRAGLNPPVNHGGKISYSQCGEDLLIDYILRLRNVHQPTYIDIGAHDPYTLSNTAIFYMRGCRGINIEANPQLIERFRIERSEDINLNIGVGECNGELDFYVMSDNTLSTFSEQEMRALQGYGHKLERVERIRVQTLTEILKQYNGGAFPDVMSLDVEGKDLEILQSINFGGSIPKLICVEAAEYSPAGAGAKNVRTLDFLKSVGYFEYASTNLNAIMVHEQFWQTTFKANELSHG